MLHQRCDGLGFSLSLPAFAGSVKEVAALEAAPQLALAVIKDLHDLLESGVMRARALGGGVSTDKLWAQHAAYECIHFSTVHHVRHVVDGLVVDGFQ